MQCELHLSSPFALVLPRKPCSLNNRQGRCAPMTSLSYFPRLGNRFVEKIIPGIFGVLLCACGGDMHVSSNLIRISITPGTSSLSVGQTLQLSVVGTYGDGTTTDRTAQVQWASSNATIASVSSTGVLHAKALGAVSISAGLQGLTASTNVNVKSAAPRSIAITPAPVALTVGKNVQLTVSAALSDGTHQDVTQAVTWTVSDPGIIAIDAKGMLSALKVGASNFVANLAVSGSGTIAGSNTANVVPEVLSTLRISAQERSMPLGTSQRLTVEGAYNDGTVRDLTATVSWSSTPSSVIRVSPDGEATGLALGTATVSAAASGIQTSMNLEVSAPVLSSISISPSDPRVLAGKGISLKAIGSLTDRSTSDLTSTVAWTVEDPRILEIDSGGNAMALSPGTTAITASLHGLAGKSNVVVRPVALVSYFSAPSSKMDNAVRMVGSTGNDPEICTMVFVVDQDQQMSECCGCRISREGLRGLSLRDDLLANPLTASPPETGTLVLVTAAFNGNTSCDPAAFSVAGFGNAWATHIQGSGATLSATETPFTQTELGNTLMANLQAQCSYIQTLGGGRGVCTCGTGD